MSTISSGQSHSLSPEFFSLAPSGVGENARPEQLVKIDELNLPKLCTTVIEDLPVAEKNYKLVSNSTHTPEQLQRYANLLTEALPERSSLDKIFEYDKKDAVDSSIHEEEEETSYLDKAFEYDKKDSMDSLAYEGKEPSEEKKDVQPKLWVDTDV